jgi:2-keto-4-pentenoate hydratase/2-oxohepta-3-ene-1,7-dioic acid hydratase in catechol pathway
MRWARVEVEGSVRNALLEGDELSVVEGNAIEALTGRERPRPTGERIPLAGARLVAPLSARRNVMCVGWNYLPHFEERSRVHGERPLPDVPAFFTKTTTAVIGPFDPVPSHAELTPELDFEVEMGVVIGEQVADLREEDALAAVAGYLVANDVSARDLQKAHGGQWYKGKSLDGTCPIGPWIVSADEIPDPQALDISCRLNGEVMQSSNTRHMIFPIARLLAELSKGLTLLPGDIVLTGTPEGVGFSRVPPVFLRAGDVLESTVEGIGTLRNVIA